jgi:hypothetical protein
VLPRVFEGGSVPKGAGTRAVLLGDSDRTRRRTWFDGSSSIRDVSF